MRIDEVGDDPTAPPADSSTARGRSAQGSARGAVHVDRELRLWVRHGPAAHERDPRRIDHRDPYRTKHVRRIGVEWPLVKDRADRHARGYGRRLGAVFADVVYPLALVRLY